MRILDSKQDLRRKELLEKIRNDLKTQFDLSEGDVTVTGTLVLYNNMLQSLFASQIWSLGAVMVGIAIVQDPYATWVMVMTYIPFITPTMMMMRVIFLAPAATSYSLFSGILAEATIGLVLVIITSLAVIWVTSRVFRVGILMYGKRPTLPEIIKWVRY